MTNLAMFWSRKKKPDPEPIVNPGHQLILSEHLRVQRDLGEGQYGVVQLAEWNPQNGTKPKYVAIKNLKNADMESVLEEARAMQKICHNNIVQMYGISLPSKDEPLKLITEYAPHGSLEENLQKKQRDVCQVSTLSKFAVQIAEGMNYLANQNLVHRDLSTRNILVFEPDLVKISDFGLARTLEGGAASQITIHRKLAVAWLPPEAIRDNLFTLWSDVWSYGITLWEMFSFGEQPWAELSLHKIKVMITNEPNNHLLKPDACPDGFYEIMLGCWEPDPKRRPMFGYISNRLAQCQPKEGVTKVRHNTAEEGHLSYNNKEKVTVISKQDGMLLVQSETGYDHIGLVHEKNVDFSKRALQKRLSNGPATISRPYDIKREIPKFKKTPSFPFPSASPKNADVEGVSAARKRWTQPEENGLGRDLLDLRDDGASDPTNPLDPARYAGNPATEHAQINQAATGSGDYDRLVQGTTGHHAIQQPVPQATTEDQLLPQAAQANEGLAPQDTTRNPVAAQNAKYTSMGYAGAVDGPLDENYYMSMDYQQRNLPRNQGDNGTVTESQESMSRPDHPRPPRTQSESDVAGLDFDHDYAVPFEHLQGKGSKDDTSVELGSKRIPATPPTKKPPPDIPARPDLQENKSLAAGGARISATTPRKRPVPTPRKIRPVSADSGEKLPPGVSDNSESISNNDTQSKLGASAKKEPPEIPPPYQPRNPASEQQELGKVMPGRSEKRAEEQTGESKQVPVEVEDQPSGADSLSEPATKNKLYITLHPPIPNGHGPANIVPSQDSRGQEMSSEYQVPLPPTQQLHGATNNSDSSQLIEGPHYVNGDEIKRLSADLINLFSNPENGAPIAEPIYDKPINLPPPPDIPEEIVNQPPPPPDKLFGGTLARDLDTRDQSPVGDLLFNPEFQPVNPGAQIVEPVTEPVNPVPQPVNPVAQPVSPAPQAATHEGAYGEEIDAGIKKIRDICGEEVSRDWCYAALLQYQGDIDLVARVIKTQKLSKLTGKTEQFCERTLNHSGWNLDRAAVYIFENFEGKDV